MAGRRIRVGRWVSLLTLVGVLMGAAQGAKFPMDSFRATDAEGNVIQLGFDTTGVVTVLVNGENFARIGFSVKADEIEFKEISAPPDYSCGTVVGRYKWHLDKDQLSFAIVDDACDVRSRPISSLAWMKVTGH